MRMKRTRPIRGKYFLTIPRIAIEGKIYEIKVKISQVIVEEVGKTSRGLPAERHGLPLDVDSPVSMNGKRFPPPDEMGLPPRRAGEIERGSVDGEE